MVLLLSIHLVFLSTGSGSAPTLVPPVLRGLTELFLVVENLAQVSIKPSCLDHYFKLFKTGLLDDAVEEFSFA